MNNKLVPPAALELIKKYEGLDMCAYICPSGKLTIGYGHVLTAEEKAAKMVKITEEKAEELLLQDVSMAVKAGLKEVTVILNDNQIAALTCLIFNIGAGAFKKSTLLKLINGGKSQEAITQEWMKWVWGGGRVLPGLVKRRTAEVELYFKE